MKKFLLSLLVFVMLTPGLACATFVDHQNTPMAKQMPGCPKHDQKSDMGAKLFKDCSKIDLQHVGDASLLKKVDIVKVSSYLLPQDLIADGFETAQVYFIRGPPDPRGIFNSYPPVFLATQRLRI